MTLELRVNDQDVVVVRDERYYGGRTLPWHVVHVPAGVHSHWPTQALAPQAVGTWDRLHRHVPCVCQGRRVVKVKLIDGGGWVLAKCPVCNDPATFYELVAEVQ